jgi:hypothetical protein
MRRLYRLFGTSLAISNSTSNGADAVSAIQPRSLAA